MLQCSMKKEASIFRSFDAADEAELQYYASLTPDERVNILLAMIEQHRESLGESAQRFERVYRVTDLAQD